MTIHNQVTCIKLIKFIVATIPTLPANIPQSKINVNAEWRTKQQQRHHQSWNSSRLDLCLTAICIVTPHYQPRFIICIYIATIADGVTMSNLDPETSYHQKQQQHTTIRLLIALLDMYSSFRPYKLCIVCQFMCNLLIVALSSYFQTFHLIRPLIYYKRQKKQQQ